MSKFFTWLGEYVLNFLVALDCFCNAFFLRGCPQETMSSVAFRKHRDGQTFGFMMYVINALFFNKNHCAEAYVDDRNRKLPT